jgi:hypothetical protein
MEYLDEVFAHLKTLEPGRYPIRNLREPERFIKAVKELIDGSWLPNVHFSQDYFWMIIQQPYDQFILPILERKKRSKAWDDRRIQKKPE